MTHDGQISQTLLLTGHVGSESIEASLHKVFVSFKLLRGKDIGELPTLFRDNMKDNYEDLILNNNDDCQTSDDFIEIFIEGIAAGEAQGETTITLSPKDTLYLVEFYRIFKVGGIASPYATIEWPCVQIPQAITAILQDKGLNINLVNNDGEYHEAPIYFFERNRTRTRLR